MASAGTSSMHPGYCTGRSTTLRTASPTVVLCPLAANTTLRTATTPCAPASCALGLRPPRCWYALESSRLFLRREEPHQRRQLPPPCSACQPWPKTPPAPHHRHGIYGANSLHREAFVRILKVRGKHSRAPQLIHRFQSARCAVRYKAALKAGLESALKTPAKLAAVAGQKR